MTDIYLALFQSRRYPNELTKLHWMLVPVSPNDNLNDKITGYQIILPPAPGSAWQVKHTTATLTGSGRTFYGCLFIGRVQLSKQALDAFVRAEPAAQGDTPDLPIFVEHGRGWSCAQWVIRVLRKWEEDGLMQLDPVDPSLFYLRVCAMGAALRKHIEDDSEDEFVEVQGSPVEMINVNGIETIGLAVR
ncbi:hypothetical protein C8R43DRAFT_979369 [Mycena crocata]|nr:hypothetical protein C8R43DRAFT_979369 [Mycena crocata]